MAKHEKLLFDITDLELARFDAHIWDRGEDECWPWIHATTFGYGAATIRKHPFRAHRVVMILGTGTLVPSDKDVAHRCHYRRCCNPAHLYLEDQAANRGEPSLNGRNPRRDGFSYVDRKPVVPREELIRLRWGVFTSLFWSHTEINSDNDCWNWRGSKNKGGYGTLSFKVKRLGIRKDFLAHRLSYLLEHGPFPKELHVRHKCDIPCCVNPVHLELGTHRDNMRDMAKRGRARGLVCENSGRAKLSNNQVREIRRRLAEGESTYSLGRAYGVHAQTIWCIKARKSWTSLDAHLKLSAVDTPASQVT